jgi:phosphoribosylformylglycinamidine synthase subunit PurSL
MLKSKYRIEVFYKITDSRSLVAMKKLQDSGYNISEIRISDNYLINGLDDDKIKIAASTLIQPVIQDYLINEPFIPENFNYALEIGFLPGVTDNISHTIRESIEDLFKIKLDRETSVFSSITYFFSGDITEEDGGKIALELYNPLIQRMKITPKDVYLKSNGMGNEMPIVKLADKIDSDTISLDISENELEKLGKEGIADKDGSRRGPLALDMLSMNVIKNYFQNEEKRDPTDIEIESIAQTWSEHCKHTIFSAELDEIDEGTYKRYIKEATIKIRRDKGKDDFCLSVFTDNAGGIEFDENYIVADKVETHNSPSALDPFGGSITGIVGVNRDAMGFGMASKPIANRYGYCFANPDDKDPLYRTKDKNSKLLSPRRIMDGVIHGVNIGGNHSGIPTPQGFLYFDDRYKGKPLVFVGTIGLIPKLVNGKSSVLKKAMPGDYIVMTGGRVGRDGIHGATFSSEALNSGSPATAVQIGDPITQKKMSDALVKEARDLGLYNSITDNGAGGISCSVAEMAREAGGFTVDLEKVPLKYPGLSPWQIWISESQERMTLSIPPESIDEFNELMKKRGVESTIIGKFNDSDRAIVNYNNTEIFNLNMDFLHDGLPKKKLKTVYEKKNNDYPEFPVPENMTKVFYDMIATLNTSSFEFISTQYDHEVQSNSVLKPLQGRGKINGNVSVIKPVQESKKGVLLSQSLYPSYSDIDTYKMAAASIDTAIRNIISAGGTLDRIALLDNFCWCDSTNPVRLAELKDAAKACYDTAVAYGTPFISGKDSMFNDFKGYDHNFNPIEISVPPTLLISSIGVMNDIEKTQSLDFKFIDDIIYIIGETKDETGGSEYLAYTGEKISGKKYIGENIPDVNSEKFIPLYRALEKAINEELVSSSISIERGGLGVALTKSSMAGKLGAEIDLGKIPGEVKREDTILYSESQGRLLVSVDPKKKEKFEKIFKGLAFASIGKVIEKKISIKGIDNKEIVNADINVLLAKHKNRFKEF